jgi:hypothetical protein
MTPTIPTDATTLPAMCALAWKDWRRQEAIIKGQAAQGKHVHANLRRKATTYQAMFTLLRDMVQAEKEEVSSASS